MGEGRGSVRTAEGQRCPAMSPLVSSAFFKRFFFKIVLDHSHSPGCRVHSGQQRRRSLLWCPLVPGSTPHSAPGSETPPAHWLVVYLTLTSLPAALKSLTPPSCQPLASASRITLNFAIFSSGAEDICCRHSVCRGTLGKSGPGFLPVCLIRAV
eukprot:scaffold9409_cov116-Isochrysis_galbana.AAC.7